MTQRNKIPLRYGMLHRPRIHALIEEGLLYPLLVMLAGPGYGKTQAMANCLSRRHENPFWIRLCKLDNLHTHFWNHLVRALRDHNPDLSGGLQKLSFPDTLSSFNAFVDLLAKSIMNDNGREAIWVFDDFGVITDQRVRNFFRMLVDAEVRNFHIVLMSNVLAGTESITFMTDHCFLITGEDLRFTKGEISELYALHGIALDKPGLEEVAGYTEGWALPLHLLVMRRNELAEGAGSSPHNPNAPLIPQSGRLTHRSISLLFEERFFSAYPERVRKILVSLSLLNFFSKELAVDLFDMEQADITALDNHVFIIYEPAADRFYFHQLYHMFLQQKQFLISGEEIRRMFRKAAEYYAAAGDAMEAISCYRKCGDHSGMLRAVENYIRLENDITAENAAFLLEHLDLLSPEEALAYPVAGFLRALVHLNLLELDRAESLLRTLADDLSTRVTPEASALLGEVSAVIGGIHLMESREDFGRFYEKAVHYLPEGSAFHSRSRLLTRNTHCFSLPDNLPGAKERMELAVHEGIPWVSRFLRGSMSGNEHLFSAEGAYLSFDMEGAKQHAYRAMYKAEANHQHDLVCNSYAVLARIGLMQGDLAEMSRQVEHIVRFAETCDIGVIKEIRDTVLGWYYIKLRDDRHIPRGIAVMNNDSKPIWAQGRAQLVYANYLIHTGEYARLVGMLEYPRGPSLIRGISPDRIALHIMLAIGYFQLGNPAAAMKSLWAGYDMSHHNGLITLFIEADQYMIALIDHARRQDDFHFDSGWLERVRHEASRFSKRAESVRIAYRQENPAKATPDNPLSKRERMVLQALSQGLTREEISHRQYISINTVKSTIRNIYNKLDAGNRAEAVSIAIANGFIEGHTSE